VLLLRKDEEVFYKAKKKTHNKALHRTAIPLRLITAGELGRYR
jgi:hypothetical protein